MTDKLPERIWACPESEYGYDSIRLNTWSDVQLYRDGYETLFLRADTAKAEAEAMVAAMAKVALDACMGEYLEDLQTDDDETYQQAVTDCCVAVQSLTPADARAAFERAVQEAVEAERDRIVKIVASYVGCENIVAAIRAQETSE